MAKKVNSNKRKTTNNYGKRLVKEANLADSRNQFPSILSEHLSKQIILIAVVVVLIIYLFMNLDKVGEFLNKLIAIA